MFFIKKYCYREKYIISASIPCVIKPIQIETCRNNFVSNWISRHYLFCIAQQIATG